MKLWFKCSVFVAVALLMLFGSMKEAKSEVILQLFETQWEEIYRRLPEIAEIGYSGIWHPSPAKSPVAGGQFAGGGNVGYSLFDRFDLGDIPQRGDRATSYGTRGHLRKMVDNAHQTDVKIYPDIVMNHAGNGPHFWTYPGMRPNDFHGWWNENEPGGFRRSERMNAWGDIDNGWGLTFQQELVSLIDIVTERDNRFSGTRGYAVPDVFVRQPGQYDLYPFHGPGDDLPEEHPVDFLNRWIVWLGDAMNFDGARFDAPKHVIADFFGTAGEQGTFNHELQYSYKSRRGFDNWGNVDEMYQNDLRRRDTALIFSEFFIGSQSEIDYWRNYGNEFRYIDFPRRVQMINPAFNDGNLGALNSFAGFGPDTGVMFIESHDETPPWRRDLGYAYILTRVGIPIVYSTGNNLADSESKVNTWMLPGHPGALGDYGLNLIPNLVYINNNFARGNEWMRLSEGNFFAFERYEDLNGNGAPDQGEGLLLVALSTADGDNSRWVETAFQPGTVLKDYTGNAGNLTVNDTGWVEVNVPRTVDGGGFVAYAPYNAEGPTSGEPIRFHSSASPVAEMDWIVPGGRLADDKPRTLPRVTSDTVDIDVHFTEPDGVSVDSVMIKWGEGDIAPNTDTETFFYDSGRGIISGGFQQATEVAAGHWRLTADVSQFPEGLNVIQARLFNQRDPGLPALFQTFRKVIYVDRHGPDLEIVNVSEGETLQGNPMIEILNPDRLAAAVEYSLDGSDWFAADQVMPGFWQFAMPSVSAGSHTLHIRAGEYDWGEPRTRINESTITRSINVVNPSIPVGIFFERHAREDAPDDEIHMPFFTVRVDTHEAISASDVRIFWNEYEMINLDGTGEIRTVFDGQFVNREGLQRLWGAFVNGPHVFEAHVEHGGQTYVASRRVVFNLYGANLIDSDGDGLPDNVEMEFYDTGTNPGYGQTWPGDGNEDMIPNDGENWTRLNPLNHDTTYNGMWDGDEDWSGDGFSNLHKVMVGYWVHGNAYEYGIYDNHSGNSILSDEYDFGGTDGGTPGNPASVTVDPSNPDNSEGGATVTITYTPNEGPLENAAAIYIHLGFNGWSVDVESRAMTSVGEGAWEYEFVIPDEAFLINYVFRSDDSPAIWDNNNGNDWSTPVIPLGGFGSDFEMDGALDSEYYELAHYNGMRLWAAVRGTTLYVATWGTGGGGNDHMIYINDRLGDAAPSAWAKAGYVFLGDDHIFLAGDGDNSWSGWFGTVGTTATENSADQGTFNYLEGTINLVEEFGEIPEALYMAVGTYARADGSQLNNQVPAPWDVNEHIEVTEFLRVPINSIRDDTGSGHFDGGNPMMWTIVNGNEQNANYGLRRFFIDEVTGDQEWLTVEIEPRTGRDGQIVDIELFSNLNRRDYAVLPGDENWDDITPTSLDSYYMAYPMEDLGGGRFGVTLPVNKAGAYRVNARWRFSESGPWYYYTDNGLRRDTAVVVSPRKALDTIIYELNPLTAEATSIEFAGRSTFRNMIDDEPGRPNRINPQNLLDLGINMIWLQPIHPIGEIGREIDPLTGDYYDPGSPYAVQNYWEVNPVLGEPATRANAMTEFIDFVEAYNNVGIGIMLDGTFNHSAWDAEIGVMAETMDLRRSDGGAINPSQRISEVRPGWYSRADNYGLPATYFNSMADNDMAVAPDRIDFGKWEDVVQFYFGVYDTLVQGPISEGLESNWHSGWNQRFLREDDWLAPLQPQTRELWDYFANYAIYWMEQTGIEPGMTKEQQAETGIAGLRCDFAQGLPNEFWEYAINRSRQYKWDLLYMAESLDGMRSVDGSLRHGVGYRSARHFDILNENIVFLWRDQFFNYRTFPDMTENNPNRSTGLLFGAFDDRKNAFEMSPILLNLISHDEIFPTDDQWSLLYAYAINTAMDGVPMIFYGQEMGAQNNIEEYGARTDYGISANNNFALYETNFGKSIPNFKRYNHMTNVWSEAEWKDSLMATYARLNMARLNSPALRSQQNYFLADSAIGGWNDDIFAVAKFQVPGVSAAEQDVVFALINNNFREDDARFANFDLSAEVSPGVNWFGIQPTHQYNVVDLASEDPTQTLWDDIDGVRGISGADLIANGLWVGFRPDDTFTGGQAQYLRLIDETMGMTGSSVNDYLPPRLAAPAIQAIGNQSVAAGETLSLAVNVTVADGDQITLSLASDLAPGTWSLSEAGVFAFNPTSSEEGVHTFRFTATGTDGFDEQTITVMVTGDEPPSPFESWLAERSIDENHVDGSGFTPWEQYVADTDPNDGDSYPRILQIMPNGTGWRVDVEKASDLERIYRIYKASEMENGDWDWKFHHSLRQTEGQLEVMPTTSDKLIFRVEVELP